MKNKLTRMGLVIVALMFTIPTTKAVITVPDDFLYYDTGILNDSTLNFQFPDWMQKTEAITWKNTGKVQTRSVEEFYEMWNCWDKTKKIWGIVLPSVKDAVRKDSVPSDSLILHLPYCDSIYIQGGIVGKGLMARIQGEDTLWYSGAASGYPDIVKWKPARKDSVHIVIYPTTADWFSTKLGGGSSYGVVYNQYTHLRGERLGLYVANALNRIKIFKPVVPPVIPPYEGLLSGWDFQYKPSVVTGTPWVDSLAPSDGTWEGAFTKYASETGVIRGVISVPKAVGFMQLGKECGGVQNLKFSNAGRNDSAVFTNSATYSKYYQIDLSTKGYNKVKFDFDFNIRDGADSCVVLVSTDKKNFTVAGKFPTTDQFDGLSHVSMDLPQINNAATAVVRLLLNNGEYGENGEFILANVKINADVCEKIAYVNNSGSSSSDYVYPILKDYSVGIKKATYTIDSLTWATDSLTADSVTVNNLFASYDAVVFSDYAKTTDKMSKTIKYLAGNKPVLNLKASSYGSSLFNWATASDGDFLKKTETSVVISNDYLSHPVFKGINIQNNTVAAFDSLTASKLIKADTTHLLAFDGKDSLVIKFDTTLIYVGVNGFLSNTYNGGKKALNIASPIGSSDVTCIQEINDNPKAKYLLMGLSANNSRYMSTVGKQMIVNAMEYLLADTAYKSPTAIQKNRMDQNALKVYASGGTLFVRSEKTVTATLFNLFGQVVRTIRLNEGENTIGGLNPGQLYLLKANENVVKIRM